MTTIKMRGPFLFERRRGALLDKHRITWFVRRGRAVTFETTNVHKRPGSPLR
jgi:hypothetical protein